ncbi:uncharacterized protein PAN0_019c5738 [Moesziomyces antarcticus]|uniref:Uncharacterized protein n=2 Tax=Pseudozyma antarctica TaxID=84753 RepID=A0A5C3FY66_PSEA2|nr:uncharacterized protein PAN0_019c5738 [Moesziomyces antarcticus]GAK67510.1 conserved hypothetical protein [Moesziomyces antarcticus]SPO48775.1 uncharacterized protein PSANT_06466 [Moesziomyces antarcticus]
MDLIPAGSRGALRLHPGARPSRNDANIGVLPSQRWTFQSDQTCRDARFATSPLTTSSGISHSATLTPATTLASSATRSLYPATDDEASASIDADILAAQRFLRSHQPDIEIPDYILAQVFDESARDIHERGCSLDGGAIGLADAQAVALLGPLALPDKRVYAVACIGGSHRNLLLVHQLQVNAPSQDDSAFAVQTSEAEASTRALPELPSTQTDALRFIPAHQAQQTFATPILQIVASSDRMQLAVRTHSATTFFSLGPPDASALQDGPQLHPIHHARFGQDGSTQHHDVVFSPYTPNTAAAVDRAGNITMYRLPACNPDSRSSEPESSSTDASAPPPPSSASRSAEWRKHAQPSQTSPQSAALPGHVRHIDVGRCIEQWQLQTDSRDPDSSSAPEPVQNEQPSFEGPFRIAFGAADDSIILLSRHSILGISVESADAVTDAAPTARVASVFQSSFSTASFRRARFVSMATASSQLQHPLLAVCSTESIHWFHLGHELRPLFATAHHRGDDPTLALTHLPRMERSRINTAPENSNLDKIMWTLSSRNNNVISCYTVNVDSSLAGDADSNADSGEELYKLGDVPSLLPSPFVSSHQHRLGAPPLYVGTTELLLQQRFPASWLSFHITERGMLSAQMLRLDDDPLGESASQTQLGTELKVAEPLVQTQLYLHDSVTQSATTLEVDSLSNVKTRIVDHHSLQQAIFSRRQRPYGRVQNDVETTADLTERLRQSSVESTTAHVSARASTLTLGQLLRNSCLDSTPKPQEDSSSKASWSNVPDPLDGKGGAQAAESSIMALRREVRHALSSLGVSPAQHAWSRSATAASQLGKTVDGIDSAITGDVDPLEHALRHKEGQSEVAPYLASRTRVQSWNSTERIAVQRSLRDAARRMALDLALETEVFVRPKARILDEGASTQRPQQRRGTNWTPLEHRDIFAFVEEQGGTMPPPHVGSIGLSFFAPLRSNDLEAAATASASQSSDGQGLSGADLERLLPSTSSTARLLLSEWQLGEDPNEYTYVDPFEGLHRLPRASRLRGSSARARSRSFSRASSASTEDRSRSRSRSRKPFMGGSYSQPEGHSSPAPGSSYPPSLASHSQPVGSSSLAPPTLVSRRKRPHGGVISRSQPLRAPGAERAQPRNDTPPMSVLAVSPTPPPRFDAAQTQPAPPRFGSLIASEVGGPGPAATTAYTQVEAGRFGARPANTDRPPKKKKRASGF